MAESPSAPHPAAAALPTFTTARLTLRGRTMADLEACLAMDSDPGVTRFVAGPWTDPAAHRAFVEGRICAHYPPGMGDWTILAPAGATACAGLPAVRYVIEREAP
jgi:RimJ/RimL family protein N-acetyltransferase